MTENVQDILIWVTLAIAVIALFLAAGWLRR
jgi:hypothetical protein